MKADFWRGKRVFLTGHTGFKGSWLSLWLQVLGAELTGFALPPNTSPNLFSLARLGDGMRSIEGDIREFAVLCDALCAAQPEIVIHMAAQPLVRESYRRPMETYSTNVMGTVHLLEAVRASAGVRAVVNVTTDKCYHNREWFWPYREEEPMGGHDPYSSSKACSELVTAAYRSSYFTSVHGANTPPGLASARAGNVIGGGDWSDDRLIPDILRAFASGTVVRIRNPNATRPWQHVLEPLSGYLKLAQQLYDAPDQYAQPWNFGPSEEGARPVRWIVERMVDLWGPTASWQLDGSDHPHEASMLKLDISKARNRLDWHPRLDLAKALAMTVDWERRRLSGEDVRATTLAQISAYPFE